MQVKNIYQFFIVAAILITISSFTQFKSVHYAATVKMPYKKYGYSERQAAARLLDRFSFGAKPGQVDELLKIGLDTWLEQQLNGSFNEDDLVLRLASYATLDLNNETIVNRYMTAGQALRFAVKNGLVNKDSIKVSDKKEYQQKIRLLMQEQGFKPIIELQSELINQKIIRAAYSNNQLHELLTDFWFNHFNVSITKQQCQQYILTYERDAIRPNILGDFETILAATAKHPAMLEFLDNANSVSNSKAKKAQGLNENYAREIMELHTMGVDGGYTQADVTAVAKAFTGWGIRPMINESQPKNLEKRGFIIENDFLFRADKHNDSAKIILGKNFPENGGYKEGREVIHLLATNAATAQFICKKLATRFVSDTPSVSLVKQMTHVFRETNGNIKAVLTAMVNHADFWNQKITREKVKSPFELIISSVRATNADVQQPFQLFNWCAKMGQKIYFYQAPTGFPDRAAYWISTGALLNRMNFGLAFAAQKIPGIKIDLLALNNKHEPESITDALNIYSHLLLPERDHGANIQRLASMINVESVNNKSVELSTVMGNNTMLAQVAGIIIGSPEFQRK